MTTCTYHTIQVGDTVWVPIGTRGWRPATVEGIGKARYENTLIRVRFEPSKSNAHGQVSRRLISTLVKRDPKLRGADKPGPCPVGQDGACEVKSSDCGQDLTQGWVTR